MDQQPKIPTLKDAQKPQVKIKGMGAGLTLFDRLKQFKKKDLAFILAGLGTLFMAPLAEHFMMAPENGTLDAGFRGAGGGSGNGLFGSGSSPYENGNNSIAQGGAIGGAGDIITPLNVRDPSALVMGPGAAQQPPAGSAAATTPPPTAPSAGSGEDYKDALKGAASRAASAAVHKAPLPIPKIAVGGSGLRGLGAASGGNSSGSGSLGNVGGLGGGTAGAGGGGLNLVRTAPNFRGVAGARGPNSPSGLDGTKRAGANAGDAFSRTGSALGGLNAAASEQIPTGGQGFGGGGQGGSGANDKPGGGAGAAGSKSVGESLAFIEAKERMMENLKLEFEKRKLKDPELLLYGIRNDMAKGFGTELGKVLTKAALAPLSKDFWAKPGDTVSGFACAPDMTFYPDSGTDVCMTADGNKGAPGADGKCVAVQPISRCTKTTQAGKAAAPAGKTESPGGGSGPAGMNQGDLAVMAGLGDVCKRSDTEKTSSDASIKTWGASIGARANHLANAQVALMGGTVPAPCVGARILPGNEMPMKSLKDLQAEALTLIAGVGAAKDDDALTGKIKKGALLEKVTPVPVEDAVKAVTAAKTALEAVKTHMSKAPTAAPIPEILGPTHPSENKVARALDDQMTTARNTADRMLGNLTTVQEGIDKGMIEIQKMTGTGDALKKVQTTNEALAKVAAKTTSAGYEGLTKAPDVVVTAASQAEAEAKTKETTTAATDLAKTADTKVEEYKTKLAASTGTTPEEKAKDPAVVAAKTAADTAVKEAVEKDGAMRTALIGWVDKTKVDLDAAGKMVVTPKP